MSNERREKKTKSKNCKSKDVVTIAISYTAITFHSDIGDSGGQVMRRIIEMEGKRERLRSAKGFQLAP